MEIDLSLSNEELYKGCKIEEVGGRKNLVTPISKAMDLIRKNAENLIDGAERGEVELTGPMAVWAYLTVFRVVLHRFAEVYYNDGRGNRVIVADTWV